MCIDISILTLCKSMMVGATRKITWKFICLKWCSERLQCRNLQAWKAKMKTNFVMISFGALPLSMYIEVVNVINITHERPLVLIRYLVSYVTTLSKIVDLQFGSCIWKFWVLLSRNSSKKKWVLLSFIIAWLQLFFFCLMTFY